MITKPALVPLYTTAIGKILKSRGITPTQLSFVERLRKGTWIAHHLSKAGNSIPDEIFTLSPAGKWSWKPAKHSQSQISSKTPSAATLSTKTNLPVSE